MKFTLAFIGAYCFLCFNTQAQGIYKENRHNVGDIPFDARTDNPEFEVLDELRVLPYNTQCGMLIEGERFRVLEYFAEKYKQDKLQNQTGYVVIRFLVNYKGQTDRFRLYGMDNDYHPFEFDKRITDALMKLTSELDGWKTQPGKKITHIGGLPVAAERKHPDSYDYYQYLVFKMKDGQIEYILP